MSKKARDDAIERVGRALYGAYWIGELDTEEWKLAKKLGADRKATTELPSSGKHASTIARAFFRSRASAEQFKQVIEWLHQQQINLAPSDDYSWFESWFRERFPNEPAPATVARKGMVRALLNSGHRPGRGGNIGWKKFCDQVRVQSHQRCDDKTIKRDVAEILTPG